MIYPYHKRLTRTLQYVKCETVSHCQILTHHCIDNAYTTQMWHYTIKVHHIPSKRRVMTIFGLMKLPEMPEVLKRKSLCIFN